MSAARTWRFVAFTDESNPYWQTAVAALIRIFSLTWGGKYFLIVPTDECGKRIKGKFWELLEAVGGFAEMAGGTWRMRAAPGKLGRGWL